MLTRIASIAFCWLFVAAATSGQSQASDSQTLRDILGELRAIHEDLRVSETTQLLIAELQMQQAVVNRATEDTDNARTKLNDIHRDQKQIAAELERAEDQFDKAPSPDQRNAITQDIERHNSNLAGLKRAERDWNTTTQDMQQRLQNAQDKLATIEAELNGVIDRLGPRQKNTVAK
jgi:chromosome segregation ATPase